MKLIDKFFGSIIQIQASLEIIERKYIEHQKWLNYVLVISILSVPFIMKINLYVGLVVFLCGIVLMVISDVIGWRNSVRKWIKVCILYNLMFSIVLACFVQGVIEGSVAIPLFVVIYLFTWTFLSLISNSKVSLLVNEIISGISTTLFTIGTYLVNLELKKLPSSDQCIKYFGNDELFINALEEGNEVAIIFLKTYLFEGIEMIFKSFLPLIGVSALCIISVKIKEYWMKKRGIF